MENAGHLEKFVNDRQKFQLENATALQDGLNGMMDRIAAAPPEQRADTWDLSRTALLLKHPEAASHVPATYPGDAQLWMLQDQGNTQLERYKMATEKATAAEKGRYKLGPNEQERDISNAVIATGPAEVKPPTGAELDAAQQALLAKRALGQPLTPEEAASVQAYDERKRTVSDPAQLAADRRSAAAQEAANARQQAGQDFTKQEAGRSALAKIDAPYDDAVEKANTLRSVIAAAQGGNMQAAGVQSLLGTLGLHDHGRRQAHRCDRARADRRRKRGVCC